MLAQLRYDYFDRGEPTGAVENAWWEPRPDGGRVLGAVVDAMDRPTLPYRQRVHLRLGRDGRPIWMEVTLTRPDGEGSAIYRREGGLVRVEGKWAGLGFEQAIDLASEATWAPWCFAADGLHFRHVDLLGTVARLTCLALKPDGDGNPLAAVMARFEASFVAEETVMIGGAVFAAGRFRTVYSEMPAKATDFWIHGDGWPLRMATVREDGSSREIVAARVVLAENAVHRPTSSRPNP